MLTKFFILSRKLQWRQHWMVCSKLIQDNGFLARSKEISMHPIRVSTFKPTYIYIYINNQCINLYGFFHYEVIIEYYCLGIVCFMEIWCRGHWIWKSIFSNQYRCVTLSWFGHIQNSCPNNTKYSIRNIVRDMTSGTFMFLLF